MAVGADQLVLLQHRVGGQHEVRAARRVGEEGIHHHRELAAAESLGNGVGVGQHGDGVPGGDPDHAHRRILGLQEASSKERLGDGARRGGQSLEGGEIEGATSPGGEGNSAAAHAEIARDGAEGVQGADGGAAIGASLHAPAHEDGRRTTFPEELGELRSCRNRDIGAREPRLRAARPDQLAVCIEVLAVALRLGIGPTSLQEHGGDRHGDLEVGARPRLQVWIGQRRRPVRHRIDEGDPGAALPGIAEHGQEVHVAHEGVLAPDDDALGMEQVEEVRALGNAEVELAGGIAGSGADVATLDGDRAEALEEVVHRVLHDAERAPALVVEDRGGARLVAKALQVLGSEVEGFLPADRHELAVPAQERRREAVRVVLPLQEAVRPVAEEAARHRMIRIALELRDPPVLDGGEDAAGVGAIAGTGGAQHFGHFERISGGSQLLPDRKRAASVR